MSLLFNNADKGKASRRHSVRANLVYDIIDTGRQMQRQRMMEGL